MGVPQCGALVSPCATVAMGLTAPVTPNGKTLWLFPGGRAALLLAIYRVCVTLRRMMCVSGDLQGHTPDQATSMLPSTADQLR